MAETDILLAAYNGEKYIAEQIDSIIKQTLTDIRLIIQDDRSADKTFETAEGFAEKYPNITAVRREAPSGSAKANFLDMLRYAEAPYIMFSDQDDVWLPEKAEKTLKAMKALEEKRGKNVPLLVHSDLTVADSALGTISPSMFRHQGLNGKYRTLNRLYAQNNVTGCTVMINRPLLELAKGAPAGDMLMHDWWFALIAAAFGEIGFIPEPLILYRQHGGNQLGAVNNRNLKGIAEAVKKQKQLKGRVSATYAQAEAFYRQYGDKMNAEARKITEEYLSVPKKSKPARIASLISHGFLKQNLIAAAGQMLFC